MPCGVSSPIALFADDAYLYREITSTTDVDTLQNDLDQLVNRVPSQKVSNPPNNEQEENC